MFCRSITKPEQKHLGQVLTFTLSKVGTEAIRLRMLGHLALIDSDLESQVRAGLGFQGPAEKITPARQPIAILPQTPINCRFLLIIKNLLS